MYQNWISNVTVLVRMENYTLDMKRNKKLFQQHFAGMSRGTIGWNANHFILLMLVDDLDLVRAMLSAEKANADYLPCILSRQNLCELLPYIRRYESYLQFIQHSDIEQARPL